MNTLINLQNVIANDWVVFDGDAGEVNAGASVLLPVEEWVERTEIWRSHAGHVGILLEPADDPERLLPWLNEIELIAIDFPKFTDGRGFSAARLLRTRLGFAGVIRAVGHVLPDQVPMLNRCGFTEYELSTSKRADTALKLLSKQLPTYQAAVDGDASISLPGQRLAHTHS
ncbi:MAG: DUF934 domain-containing protein [Burkholderiaceae bacterium]